MFRRRNRLDEIAETLTQVLRNQGLIMTQQEELDAAAKSISDSIATLNGAVTGLAAALAAKTPAPLDVTGVTSFAADLNKAATAVAALVPAVPPAPATKS